LKAKLQKELKVRKAKNETFIFSISTGIGVPAFSIRPGDQFLNCSTDEYGSSRGRRESDDMQSPLDSA
jgi:hypothetical protein